MINPNTNRFKELNRRLRTITNAGERNKLIGDALLQWGIDQSDPNAVSGLFADFYPARPNGRPLDELYVLDGKPSKWKSHKQRRYFFGVVLKSGRFPYQRTGTLARAVTAVATQPATGGGVFIQYDVNLRIAPYAAFVVGNDKTQSRYHAKTGWPQFQDYIRLQYQDGQLLAGASKAVISRYAANWTTGR